MHKIALIAGLAPLVAGHGFITDPPARRPGTAYAAACGEQPFSQQSSDINGNVQGIEQVVGDDFNAAKCDLWLCKGFQFADNKDNVQQFSAGQKIPFTIDIAAPHTGFANVSVVKTSSNSMIGKPLIEFENYASNQDGVAANNTAFSVTLPQTLGSDCTTAGQCVLQWYWDAPDIDQTYESCVDFVVSGSGASDGSASSSPAAAVPSETSSATGVGGDPTTAIPAPSTTASPDDDTCDGEEDPEEGGDGDDDCSDVQDLDERDSDEAKAVPSLDLGAGYFEQFPTSAPGPHIITITTATELPLTTGGAGNGNGNGNGNAGGGNTAVTPTGDASKPTGAAGAVTVTVTERAKASTVTVTETVQPSLCLDLSDFWQK